MLFNILITQDYDYSRIQPAPTKCISYSAKPTFDCHFCSKNPRDLGVIFHHPSRGWKDFLYVYVCVCVCVCVHVRGHNFYPIDTKVGTQVAKVEVGDGIYGFVKITSG